MISGLPYGASSAVRRSVTRRRLAKRQHRGHLTLHLDLEATRRGRGEHDAVDQAANGLKGGRLVRSVGKGLVQALDLLAVGLGQVRVQARTSRDIGCCELGGEFETLRLEGFQLFLEARGAETLRQRVDQAGELALHLGEVASDPITCRLRVTRRAVPLLHERRRERLEELRVHDPVVEGVDDDALEFQAAHAALVGAHARLAGRGTRDVVATDIGHQAAAGPAMDLLGQEMVRASLLPVAGAVRLVGTALSADRMKPMLDRLPQVLVDDPQRRHGVPHPLGLGVEA